jgi:hypothetical protein
MNGFLPTTEGLQRGEVAAKYARYRLNTFAMHRMFSSFVQWIAKTPLSDGAGGGSRVLCTPFKEDYTMMHQTSIYFQLLIILVDIS